MPTKPAGVRLVVAAYGSNPGYPGTLGHQFTNGVIDALEIPPFGFADVNSADGYDIDLFCTAIGIGPKPIIDRIGRRHGVDTGTDTAAGGKQSGPARRELAGNRGHHRAARPGGCLTWPYSDVLSV